MEKESIAGFFLVGIKIRTTNKDAQAAKDIPLLWDRFMSVDMPNQIPNKVNQEVYCAYTEYESDWQGEYSCFLGCPVENLDEIPEGMDSLHVPASNYYVKPITGRLQDNVIGEAWQEIWQMDLPRKYTVDFERYSEDSIQPDQAKVVIYLAV